MKLKRAYAFDVKEVDDSGAFAGYASVYDVVDHYREVVVAGAFAKSLGKWQAKGRLPPVLWQHQSWEPIGPFTKMAEDARGLYVEGTLLVGEVQRAREARALIRAKAINGLSIGFNTVLEEHSKETGLTRLKEIDLWEASVVTFAANEAAQVDAIKGYFATGTPSIREFETWLRDAGGFSRAKAKAIAACGYGAILRDAGDENATGTKSPVDVRSILAGVLAQ